MQQQSTVSLVTSLRLLRQHGIGRKCDAAALGRRSCESQGCATPVQPATIIIEFLHMAHWHLCMDQQISRDYRSDILRFAATDIWDKEASSVKSGCWL